MHWRAEYFKTNLRRQENTSWQSWRILLFGLQGKTVVMRKIKGNSPCIEERRTMNHNNLVSFLSLPDFAKKLSFEQVIITMVLLIHLNNVW